jgi:crossover junction endodeoxyribonuclease RusA
MTLTLPWPDSRLLPNRKLHWAIKGRASRQARWIAWAEAFKKTHPRIKSCTAVVTFHPPDKRRRDLDNLLRACKPYWDGMVDAGLLVDDSCIREISVRMAEPSKDSRVEIELTEVKG